MKQEHELMELLSQCEDEEKGLYSPSWLAVGIVQAHHSHNIILFTAEEFSNWLSATVCSAAVITANGTCVGVLLYVLSALWQDSVYAVMEARVAEEEHTQRTMIALNEMKPSYPGKQSQEVQRILEEVGCLSNTCAVNLWRVGESGHEVSQAKN